MYRITILGLACSFGHEDCLKKMGEEFRTWLQNPDIRPHPDVRSLIYSYGMKTASEQDWETVLELFLNETDATEKAKLQAALANIDDPIILERYIELASKDETYVRKQDYFTFLNSVAANRKYGEQLVWDYVRTNWPKLVDRFGLSERNLGRMIPNVTSRMAKEIRLQEMEDFFKKYPDAGAGANARIQAQENIRNNIKWLANNKDSIGDFLNNA
jgi:glutamyl aminopeptidase